MTDLSPTQLEYWQQLLLECKPYLEHAIETEGYGFYKPENPNDFCPDASSCTEEELDRHRLACEQWNAGGPVTAHGWGIGSYTIRDKSVSELLKVIEGIENERLKR